MFDGGMFINRGTDVAYPQFSYFYEAGHILFMLLISGGIFLLFSQSQTTGQTDENGNEPTINSNLAGFAVIFVLFIVSCVAAAVSNLVFGHPTFFRPSVSSNSNHPLPVPSVTTTNRSRDCILLSDQMNDDVFITICSFLPIQGLLSLSSTNKKLYDTLNSGQTCSILYSSLIKSNFSNHKFIVKNLPKFQKSLLLHIIKTHTDAEIMQSDATLSCNKDLPADVSWCHFLTGNPPYISLFEHASPKYSYRILYDKYPIALIRLLNYKFGFSIHDDVSDLFIHMGKRVYDVSEFVHHHPGGIEIMAATRGLDATNEFERVIHSDSARRMLKELMVWSC